MTRFSGLALLVFLAMSDSVRSETFVYVSQMPEKKIQVYRLDRAVGALEPVESQSLDVGPGALSVDPSQRYLFASLRADSTVASYQIDPATGRLTRLGIAPLPPKANAAFLRADRSGKWLVSASYTGAKVIVQKLEAGQIDSTPVQVIDTDRTAHCVVFDRDERWVFVPHVAPNAVFQFRFDRETGRLTDAGRAPGGTAGAGPRHLMFHPQLPVAYTSNEASSGITAYRFDPEKGLTPEQTLSTLPADAQGSRNTTAEVKVHPNGKFVWVSNRGHDTLAGFAIDGAGKLTAIGHTPTEPTTRSFEIEPQGRFAFAAGEGSGKLAVYRIDPETGKLDRIQTYEVGKSLFWVQAVEFAK
jgi:6-phosphogluconolactonase